MTPAYHRIIFAGFAILLAGTAANLLLLQPLQTSAAPTSQARTSADQDRRLRGTAGRTVLPAAPVDASTLAAVAEPGGAAMAAPSGAPPRAAAGGAHPIAIPTPMEQGVRRFARLRPDAAQVNRPGDTLPEAPDAEGDADTIRAVQRELSARGYGQLAGDGVPGLVTRAAIMAFEHDHRLPLTGEATANLLARILLGVSGGATEAADPAAGRVRSAQAEVVMRTVQQSLAALGYQVGRVDGRAGDDIARAIREFELDEGLKPTGRVSADVFSRLGRAVATARPKPIQ